MVPRDEILEIAKSLQEEAIKLSKDTKAFEEAVRVEIRKRERLSSELHNMAVRIRKLVEFNETLE